MALIDIANPYIPGPIFRAGLADRKLDQVDVRRERMNESIRLANRHDIEQLSLIGDKLFDDFCGENSRPGRFGKLACGLTDGARYGLAGSASSPLTVP
jgi:hypothetical protein